MNQRLVLAFGVLLVALASALATGCTSKPVITLQRDLHKVTAVDGSGSILAVRMPVTRMEVKAQYDVRVTTYLSPGNINEHRLDANIKVSNLTEKRMELNEESFAIYLNDGKAIIPPAKKHVLEPHMSTVFAVEIAKWNVGLLDWSEFKPAEISNSLSRLSKVVFDNGKVRIDIPYWDFVKVNSKCLNGGECPTVRWGNERDIPPL